MLAVDGEMAKAGRNDTNKSAAVAGIFLQYFIDCNLNHSFLLIILTHSVAFVVRFLLLLEAEEVNDNNDCIPPNDTAAFDKKILLSKSRPELKQLCSDYGLLVGGMKQTLIN